MKNLLPADVVLTRADSWLGRAIRWFERGRGESPSWANHAAIMVSYAEVLEALTTVKMHPLIEIQDAFQVWRHIGLQDYERTLIKEYAMDYLGRSYGPLKLGLHALDGLGHKIFGKEIFLFRRLAFMNPYPICSWVVSYSYFKGIDYKFGVEPECADPDHIHDHVTSSAHWEMVHEQEAA